MLDSDSIRTIQDKQCVIDCDPDGGLIAAAAGKRLVILSVQHGDGRKLYTVARTRPHAACTEAITAVRWAAFASSSLPAQSQRSTSYAVDSCCLLVGTSAGYLQLHDTDGVLRLRQRLHATAVRSIAVRTWRSGIKADEPLEEVTVTFADAVLRVGALQLKSLLKMCQLATAGGRGGTADPRVAPLHYQKWELPGGVGPRHVGCCVGYLPTDLYSILSVGPVAEKRHRMCVLTGGAKPSIAALEVEEQPQRGALAMLAGVATSVTSGVFGLARNAVGQVTSRQKALTDGLKSWVLNPLNLYTAPAGADAAFTFDDLADAPKPETAALWRSIRDDARVVGALLLAPRGALAAVADNLGRVSLVDAASTSIIRMWKGYRDVQCGWLEVTPAQLAQLTSPSAPLAVGRRASVLLLVLYAPRRQVLELWPVRSGPRVASAAVTEPSHLLMTSAPLGMWNAPGVGGPDDIGVGNGSAGTVAPRGQRCMLMSKSTGQLLDVLEHCTPRQQQQQQQQ